MTKQELEKAIENGESVWYITGKDVRGLKITKKDLQRITKFDEVYKTKAEAEHYLHHANVTRTETLSFLTWEEFTSDIMAFNSFGFITEDGFRAGLMCDKATNLIILDSGKEIRTWDLTEADFYNAYDECVRLFKGE